MKGKAFWLTLVAVAALGLAVFALPALARPVTPVTTAASADTEAVPEWCHGEAGPGMMGGAGAYDSVTLSRIAAFLGLTPQELSTRLGQGQTLAAIATEQGKTVEGLVEVILAPYREHLAVAVKYGYLTQAEADALYATRAQEALASGLSTTTLTYAPGFGGTTPGQGYGGMMGGGMMGGGMMGQGMMGGGMMGGGGNRGAGGMMGGGW